MTTKEISIAFRTDKFDYRSELPEHYNAGNRFYGEDVAAYLCEHLTQHGVQAAFGDEDWGWWVDGPLSSSGRFEIAVYKLYPEDSTGEQHSAEWGLIVSASQKYRFLKLLPVYRAVPVPSTLTSILDSALQALGCQPYPWMQ